MHPGLAGRVFGIAPQPIQVGLRPGINASIRVHTVIQVNAGIVLVEDIAEALIGASAQCLHSLSVAGPGRRVIGLRLVSCASVVGDFGERALALFFAPAHPLWTRLQFFQGGEHSCVKNVCVSHSWEDLSFLRRA